MAARPHQILRRIVHTEPPDAALELLQLGDQLAGQRAVRRLCQATDEHCAGRTQTLRDAIDGAERQPIVADRVLDANGEQPIVRDQRHAMPVAVVQSARHDHVVALAAANGQLQLAIAQLQADKVLLLLLGALRYFGI